ncbi:MAG: DUF433 domain-containing protein [Gemmatimonadales bacterium]
MSTRAARTRHGPPPPQDVRSTPAYTVAEAARYVKLPPATLRSWVVGRSYPRRGGKGFFEPLIALPEPSRPLLSFWNLVEAHVLKALRTEHGVPIRAVRNALDTAERELGTDRLLLRPELRTEAGDLLVEKYGELVNLSKSGQLAMKKVLESHLKRVEWDRDQFPIRLYPPTLRRSHEGRNGIAIDPEVAFGRPTVLGSGVTTAVIADRVDAGETLQEIAADYDLDPAIVEEAVVYERAA